MLMITIMIITCKLIATRYSVGISEIPLFEFAVEVMKSNENRSTNEQTNKQAT